MENDFIPDSSITSSSIFNIYHNSFYARPNTQRNVPRSWCTASETEKRPYLQVDLGEIKSVCAVGTMGRGSLDYHFGYPISYSAQLSNDSFNWTYVAEGNNKNVSKKLSMFFNREYWWHSGSCLSIPSITSCRNIISRLLQANLWKSPTFLPSLL